MTHAPAERLSPRPTSWRSRLRALAVRLLPHRALFLLRRLAARWRPEDEPELALVRALGDPRRAFLDVGANKGLYLQAALGRFAEVLAVEPHPGLGEYLRACFGARVRLLPVALSDRQGSLPLYLPKAEGREVTSRASLQEDANPGFVLDRVVVPVERLDALDLPPLAVIKIDVEGHEFAVLRGGLARLEHDRPVLVVEIEERHHPGGSDGIVAFLERLGYEGRYLEHGRLRPLAGRAIKELQDASRAKRFDRQRQSGYINNFVFLHRDDRWARGRLVAAGYLGATESTAA
ncbi:FkbM family methyltransferase [Benzoatithermus flavus]|uniref:FkbM family methyltransferase n=1 Tax=Benzoatithermus flavus TaxID=3108223 RepID=A0ABU8XXQ6_9PROT